MGICSKELACELWELDKQSVRLSSPHLMLKIDVHRVDSQEEDGYKVKTIKGRMEARGTSWDPSSIDKTCI